MFVARILQRALKTQLSVKSAGKICQRFSFYMSDIFHGFYPFHLFVFSFHAKKKGRSCRHFVDLLPLFSVVLCVQSSFYFVKDFKFMNIVLKEGFLGHTENRVSRAVLKAPWPARKRKEVSCKYETAKQL